MLIEENGDIEMNLEEEERKLLQELENIRIRKGILAEEKRKKEEIEKKVTVEIKRFYNGLFYLTSQPYRQDMRELLTHEKWKGAWDQWNKEFRFPVSCYDELVEEIGKVQKLEFKENPQVSKDIHSWLHDPNFTVDISHNAFVIKTGPKADSSIISRIYGANWNHEKRHFTVPLTEAVKVWERLSNLEKVEFSDKAKTFILDMVERRVKLDKIALSEDVNFPGRDTLFFDSEDNVGENKNRPFQNVGIEFAWLAGGNVINADEMGLGKTRQAIGYAIRLHKHIKMNQSRDSRILYICPGSLKRKVSREIKRLTGVIPYTCVGSTPANYDIASLLGDRPRFVIINYDIIRTSSMVVNETLDAQGNKHIERKERFPWIELLNMCTFDLVIVDEAHKIKNTDSKQSQAVRKLQSPRFNPLTGTPVLNRPDELWAMLSLIAPALFPSKEKFLKDYTYDGYTPRNVDELRSLLRPLMIRRLKKDVQKDLPPINRIEEYCEISSKAAKIYKKIMIGVYESVAAFDSNNQSYTQEVTNILAQIMRLKQVCAIDKVDRTAELAIEAHESLVGGEEENNKVIIFSQFKAVAYAISRRLQGEGVLCFVERGEKGFVTISQADRDNMVQQFQSDNSIKYMVVTEKTATEGHDMTKAGTVIFNDLFWTPASHQQGEGRAYGRLLDSHSISSYYMIVDSGEDKEYVIEEWIWELLHKKMNIIEQVVEGVQSSRDADGSIVMELIQRIKNSMGR